MSRHDIKTAWLNDAWNKMPTAWVSDQGVWANLHLLYGQGYTVVDALERVRVLLPRLAQKLTPAEESAAMALEALVNWCWNTEKHLTRARVLKAETVRNRKWYSRVRNLLADLQYEVGRAEPDTLSALHGRWPLIPCGAFIDAIPNPD